MDSIRGRYKVTLLAGVVMLASAVHGAPSDHKPVRAVDPSEMNYVAVPGYPPGYARAMLEGEADKAIPFAYRVRLPAGFTSQPHTHPADEHVTVLQGTWSLGVGDRFEASRVRSYPVGSFVVIPAGTPHFLSIDNETIVQVHGIGPIGFRLVGARAASAADSVGGGRCGQPYP